MEFLQEFEFNLEQVVGLFVLAFGVLLLLVGVGFVWAPNLVTWLSHRLNTSFDPSNRLREVIDKEFHSDQWIIGNRLVLGVVAFLMSFLLIGYHMLLHR